MAVYTDLGTEQLAELIAAYDVGSLRSAKGIAEGVSNSNWLIETSGAGEHDGESGARFILTMYERRIETADLPFFLDLLDHLSAAGCPVPRTVHDRAGASFRMVDGKAVALIEFLPGVSPTTPSPAQARAVGVALARMHAAAQDFAHARANELGPKQNLATLEACGDELAQIDNALPQTIERARHLVSNCPSDLPSSIDHYEIYPHKVQKQVDQVRAL
ncbi:MAG: phosphotransferase, partial [Erythrobacter sp.]|nr:phosphotransferase [Erythrobacter sp.]